MIDKLEKELCEIRESFALLEYGTQLLFKNKNSEHKEHEVERLMTEWENLLIEIET